MVKSRVVVGGVVESERGGVGDVRPTHRTDRTEKDDGGVVVGYHV